MTKNKRIDIRLNEMDFKYVEKQAKKRYLSKPAFVRMLIRWYRKRKRKK